MVLDIQNQGKAIIFTTRKEIIYQGRAHCSQKRHLAHSRRYARDAITSGCRFRATGLNNLNDANLNWRLFYDLKYQPLGRQFFCDPWSLLILTQDAPLTVNSNNSKNRTIGCHKAETIRLSLGKSKT
jgi:hypothetical protein